MKFPPLHAASRRAAHPARQAGFSLIELMVGVVIGMIAIVVISQVFSLSEGFKRTTLRGDEATNNGAIALATIQGDVRQAGYGVNAVSGTTSRPALYGCSLALQGGWTLPRIAPAVINDAALPPRDANTDTLTIMYGNGGGSPEGDPVLAPASPTAVVSKTYVIATPDTFFANDRIVALPSPAPAPCALSLDRVLAKATAPTPQVTVDIGFGNIANGSTLFNLGPAPRMLAYRVREGVLRVCDYMASDCTSLASAGDDDVWLPIADNVVSLRVQYGRDTSVAMDNVVDIFDQTAPTNACEWARVSALRVSLVTRSAQLERVDPVTGNPVTTAAPTLADPMEEAPVDIAPLSVDLSGNPDWQMYRYRVFETTAPLRNIAWQGVPAGC
jgi:type IV pilus assembly protein PilW